MSSISKYRVSLFPTVAILRYSRVHVGTSNGSNITAEIKGVINEKLSLGTLL